MKNAVIFFSINILIVNCLELEEVFVLSRHNLRAPLTKKLQNATPYLIPRWDTEVAYLTPKGFLLEKYMGEYFEQWLTSEGLFTDGCPGENSVYIYTNVKQRTIETGRAFAEGAFENCLVTIHSENFKEFDPVFHPSIKNTTNIFKKLYKTSMKNKLDNLNLNDAYTELDKIIDFRHSDLCEFESFCDLVNTKDLILYDIGLEPDVYGPLSIGNSFVDLFLMSYYKNTAHEEIAWGKITEPKQWRKLLQITKENQNVRFNHTLARDISKPLIDYIKNSFVKNNNRGRKFTMLVGHDSNLNSILASFEFKNYDLHDQLEKTPIGGKIVFQKWIDSNDNYFLKINYIYQSIEQIRNSLELSLNNPPQSVILEMNDCKIDGDGFCPWDDFVKYLDSKKFT